MKTNDEKIINEEDTQGQVSSFKQVVVLGRERESLQLVGYLNQDNVVWLCVLNCSFSCVFTNERIPR